MRLHFINGVLAATAAVLHSSFIVCETACFALLQCTAYKQQYDAATATAS